MVQPIRNKINNSSLSNAQLKQQIICPIFRRTNGFWDIDFASFPLTRSHANQYAQKYCAVLIGDAAHMYNPLQPGVNLGLKE